MKDALYFIRDNLVGTHYFLYAFILSIFMFSLVGYLFKKKYGVLNIKMKSSQENVKEENKKINTASKNQAKKESKKEKSTQTTEKAQTVVKNQTNTSTQKPVDTASIPEIK